MKKINIALSFSGGKDAMMALYRLQQSPKYEVACLVTTISEAYRRVVMQGVRESLVDAQAKALGIPLMKVVLEKPTIEDYERKMAATYQSLKQQGISHIAYGDIFLSSLKAYRDKQLEQVEMSGLYPLWQADTNKLVKSFWQTGHKAIVSAMQGKYFSRQDVGKAFDADFIESLPESVDPAGENGEFHTFVTHSPLFVTPISVSVEDKVFRSDGADNDVGDGGSQSGSWYADLIQTV